MADDERDTTILRRTLGAVSWLYALWSGLLGATAMALRAQADPVVDPRLILLHAALLGLAGTLLWRPRAGSLHFTLLAAAGSIAFVILDLRRGNVPAALIDGAYVVVAAALLYKSRRRT